MDIASADTWGDSLYSLVGSYNFDYLWKVTDWMEENE